VRPVSDFDRFILPFLRDCSAMAAEVAARFAIIEFCTETRWLKYEADPISILAGVAAYEFECPQDTQVAEIVSATIADQSPPLQFKTQDELAQLYGDWRAAEGTPRFFTQIERDYVRLVPSPLEDVPQGLRLVLCLAPTTDAPEVDDTIYDRYAETIGYGARARLKEMAGQPYYDPVSAPAAWAKFYEGVSAAKNERDRDFGRAVKTVQFVRFGK
jgi:hypothetical protein